MILGLKAKTFGLVVLFTLVETFVLAEWLILADKGLLLASVLFLFAGLLIEHYLSAFIGKSEASK